MRQWEALVVESFDIAQAKAMEKRQSELYPEHLLFGFISHPRSLSSKAFKGDCSKVEKALSRYPTVTSPLNLSELKTGDKLGEWITKASARGVQGRHSEIREEDFLFFLPEILPQLDLDYEKLKSLGEGEEEKLDFLVDLNELAREGKLDPVIGRAKEIRAVMEILGRRGKNNPCLVGQAGVGKTAIVEGLALAIETGDIPDVLRGKTVYSLDLGSLIAGTQWRGEFEKRIKELLKVIKSKDGQAILFIDEIHQIIGAGKTEGAMDAANLLKPALARGELHCVGATTFDEYQKYIMNDSALERRFRAVTVNEPSKEDALEILMGIREKMEIHHGIKISDEASRAAVFLSEEYITDRYLPDKAIDLVDEAASALKLSVETMPAHLVEKEAEIRTKMINARLEKDGGESLKEAEKLKAEFSEEKKKWEEEVLSVKRVSEIKNKLDRAKFELEQSQRSQDYERAGELLHSEIPALEKELQGSAHHWVLDRSHIARVISRQIGVPVEKILKSKQDRILKLEEFLRQRVFGQQEALHEVAETLMTSYAGLGDDMRPLGSFLLLGPSGVGKTETAKALAEFLFYDQKNILRLDMSEYSEKHSVAKLIGAPSGYVGYEEGGILTEAVRRTPHSVILFDEIEKAHRDFSDILLQILDGGRLTDNKGRTINFKNTVVMMTSNVKDHEQYFKPEVLGRIDAVLKYKKLNKKVAERIIDRELVALNRQLKTKDLTVTFSPEIYAVLQEEGMNELYGARPLRSAFKKLITRPLSQKLLKGQLHSGNLKTEYKDGHLSFR